jgi:superfamily I DNA and RNA helicase
MTSKLQVIHGQSGDRVRVRHLTDALGESGLEGSLYIGYPILANADELVRVDAMLVSGEHGLVAIRLCKSIPASPKEWAEVIGEQDRLYAALDSHLSRHDFLRKGRRLSFSIETVTVFSDPVQPPAEASEGHYCDLAGLADLIRTFAPIGPEVLKSLDSALQRVVNIKPPKKRANVKKAESRGAILKQIEREIANLDRFQKRAALETPEGPQRIRGLAGSGKTVVLALKAAYLHASNPDWNIAVTFHTRSLYPQFEDLITRFMFEHTNDKPDWNKLQIVHSWGGSDRDGVYTLIAERAGLTRRDFSYAKDRYGYDDAFKGVCAEALEELKSRPSPRPLFDAVLIDEAQDLPREFFRLVYSFTKPPKRIVWAYDELQRLNDSEMPTTKELFGLNASGQELVTIENVGGQPRRDIILPVCYRNPPWTLALAHSLGLGLFRKSGMIQHFDDPTLWADIGYHVRQGRLVDGERVELERSSDSYPEYFDTLLSDKSDVVSLHIFANRAEQDAWIASQVKKNVSADELDFDDILVVLPHAWSAKKRYPPLNEAFVAKQLSSHLVGITTNRDTMFTSYSIAVSHVYRAKGNEAPMVYIADAQELARGSITLRNMLFTAITRSRAWVRICAWGPDAEELKSEFEHVQREEFRLRFKIPTKPEREKMHKLHRDLSDAEQAKLDQTTRKLREALAAIDRGDVDFETLPADLRQGLARLARVSEDDEG